MADDSTMQAMTEVLDHVSDGVYFVDTRRRISLWNKAAEQISGYSLAEVKGRCCSENILVHVDDAGCSLCRGHCPLAFTLMDGQPREATVNLHHKDGHRVPVHVSVKPVTDASGKVTGAVETFRECSDVIAMRRAIERLKQMGYIDLQSGLVNRKVGESTLHGRVQEMQRFGWPFGVLLIEVDYMKELEARWGADGLIAAIRMAAQSVTNSLRALDMVVRWQEDRFLAIVANATSIELAGIAERVRMMVDSAFRQTPDGEIHVTVSIGAAGASANDNAESVLRNVERAIYASKRAGRNRVTLAGIPAEPE